MNSIIKNVFNALEFSRIYFVIFELRQTYKIKNSIAYRTKSVVIFDRFLNGEYSRIHGKNKWQK